MKIIKHPKFKPITCSKCGGIYECTKRDMRKIIRCDEWWNSPALRCPFCGYANDLEPVRESENSDTGSSTKEYVQRWTMDFPVLNIHKVNGDDIDEHI